MEKTWIDTYGTPALQRAFAEGYGVERGVAECILTQIEASIAYPLVRSWDKVEERTSPWASAFEARDQVSAVARTIDLPAGWHIDVSRISRVTIAPESDEEEKFTGVVVSVLQGKRQIMQAVVDFES